MTPSPHHRGTLTVPASAFTLEESTRRIGRYAWFEARLFEIAGAWVADHPDAAARLTLARVSRHHGRHVELWHEQLPRIGDRFPHEAVSGPPDLGRFVDTLAAPGPDRALARLVGLFRVALPWSVAAFSHHLRGTSPVADGPVVRALELVRRDVVDDWHAGELLVQEALAAPGGSAMGEAADHQAGLEALLVATGGVTGP